MEGLDDVLERGGDDLGLDFSDLSEGEEHSSSSEPDSDEGEVEPPHMDGLSVTAEDGAKNYELLGSSLPADPPVHLLADLKLKYPYAFTPLSENTLETVLQENPLAFELSAFQVHSN